MRVVSMRLGQLRDSSMNEQTSSYYQPFQGNVGQKITCIFENPTWLEELYKRPVAGMAGSRLCVLFRILRNMECKLSNDFGSQLYRSKVCIVNGVRKVSSKSFCQGEYNKLLDENIETLEAAVADAKLIICFGDNAERAFKRLGNNAAYAKVYHLCDTALNRLSVIRNLCHKYELPELFAGLVRLSVLAEYLATWYEKTIVVEDFAKFAKPFQKGGGGNYRSEFEMHKINFDELLNNCDCSLKCCNCCGTLECKHQR